LACLTASRMPVVMRRELLVASFLHALGSLCTNLGFVFASASLVQVIKLLEPLETLLVSSLILQTPSAPITVPILASTATIMGGVGLTLSGWDKPIAAPAVVFATLSGMALAARNATKKHVQEQRSGHVSKGAPENANWKSVWAMLTTGLEDFVALSLGGALALCVVACTLSIVTNKTAVALPVEWSLHGSDNDLAVAIKLILFHPTYNMASLSVLGFVSALSHAILNVGKRLVNVIVTAVIFAEKTDLARTGVGLFLASIGATWYVLLSKRALSLVLPSFRWRRQRHLWWPLYSFLLLPLSVHRRPSFRPNRKVLRVPEFGLRNQMGHETARDLMMALPTGCKSNPSNVTQSMLQIPSDCSNTSNTVLHLYRELTRQALEESNVSGKQWLRRCKLLIPVSVAQHALQQDSTESLFSPYLKKTMSSSPNSCVLSADMGSKTPEYDLLLQIIACSLSRSAPVLKDDSQYYKHFKKMALELRLAFYILPSETDGHHNETLLCGSTIQTRHSVSVTSRQSNACSVVDQPVLDEGLVTSNFDAVIQHFFLNRYAVSVIRNEPLKVSAVTTNDDNATLGVMVSGDGKIANGGDLFGPEVAKHIIDSRKQHNVSVAVASVSSSTPPVIAIVGSILQWKIKTPNMVHWGTGIIMNMKVGKLDGSSNVLAVRGPRTRDLLLAQQGLNPMVIGDPALIAGDIIASARNDQSCPMMDVCFVIHGVDSKRASKNCPFCIKRLVNNYDRSPRRILEKLSCCRRVVSSSLHGVIFSHALGIPALPVAMGDRIMGGDFKFRDHMHAVGVTSFQSRLNITEMWEARNLTEKDWKELVDEAVQPKFPIKTQHFYETFPVVKLN